MAQPLSRLQLARLRESIATELIRMEPMFVPEMKLTFVARHPENPECYVIVTSDDVRAVAELCARDAAKCRDVPD